MKRFRSTQALSGIGFSVQRGECFGLLGPNGAGKTTTMEICEGLQRSDRGTVEVLGRSWGAGDERTLRRKLGIQHQDSRFAPNLTVLETVRLYRSFYEEGAELDDVLELFQLSEKRDDLVAHLSGGQRQRCALACAMVGKPELLFLDEPTTGLDPQSRLSLWEAVSAFRSDGGTVLLTTHYMEEAHGVCDRVAIVDHGKVAAEGTPDQLIRQLDAVQILTVEARFPLAPDGDWCLPGASACKMEGSRCLITTKDLAATLPALLKQLEVGGNELRSMSTREPTLEDVFINITGRDLRDT